MGMTALWRTARLTTLLVLAATPGLMRSPLLASGQAASLTDARKLLEGLWSLESFEVRTPGKPPIVLKGQGLLTYDNFGNLHMEVRADPAAAELLRAAGIVIDKGVISTDGKAILDVPNHTLTYFLEGQPKSGGGPLAANRKRYYELKGDTLTLTTRDDKGAPMSIAVWRRAH